MKLFRSRKFWVLAILAVALVAYLIFGVAWPTAPTVSPETTYYTAPLDAAGFPDYPRALDARLSAGIDPQQNAVVKLLEILGPEVITPKSRRTSFCKQLGIEPIPAEGNYFRQHLPELKGDGTKSDAYVHDLSAAGTRPWQDAEFPEVAAMLDANAASFARLPELLPLTQFYVPLHVEADSITSALLSFQLPDDFRSGLKARVMRELARGQAQQAVEQTLLVHRLARVFALAQDGPSRHWALALELDALELDESIAGHATVSPELAQHFAAALDHLPPFASLDRILEYERAETLEFLVDLYRDPGPDDQSAPLASKPEPPTFTIPPNLDWDVALRTANSIYDEAAPILARDDRQAFETFLAELQLRLDKLGGVEGGWDDVLLWDRSNRPRISEAMAVLVAQSGLGPGPGSLLWQQARAALQLRMARAALLLEAARKQTGVFPAQLSDVMPPGNPPLSYATDGQSFTLYWVGPDGVDETLQPYDLAEGVSGIDDVVLKFPWKPRPERDKERFAEVGDSATGGLQP